MKSNILLSLTIVLLGLYGLAGCSSDDSTDGNAGTTDTTQQTDTGGGDGADATAGTDDGRTPEADTGGTTTDAPGTTEDTGGGTEDTGPPPEAVKTCEDGGTVDITGIEANNPLQRISVLGIGGFDGTLKCDDTTARDVDDDPNTSAPATGSAFDCANGLNNALLSVIDLAAGFAGDISTQISGQLDGGSINILAEVTSEGSINFYQSEPQASNVVTENADGGFDWSECDISDADAAPCSYMIDPVSFLDDCATPLISLDNATLTDTSLEVSGDKFALAIPIDEDITLNLEVSNVQITADVVTENDVIVSMDNGLITGIIPESVLLQVVNEVLAGQDLGGLDPEVIRGFLPSFLDIDTNGDEAADAMSVGINFKSHQAVAAGVLADDGSGGGE